MTKLQAFGKKATSSSSPAKPSMRPFGSAKSPGIPTLIARRDKIRAELFAAGWKPADYMLPVTDPTHKKIMKRLNDADVAITRAKIGAL